MPGKGPAIILEALGSPLCPATPPPSSVTLQGVSSLPEKSPDRSSVELGVGCAAAGGPGSHCSEAAAVTGTRWKGGVSGTEAEETLRCPPWHPGSDPKAQCARGGCLRAAARRIRRSQGARSLGQLCSLQLEPNHLGSRRRDFVMPAAHPTLLPTEPSCCWTSVLGKSLNTNGTDRVQQPRRVRHPRVSGAPLRSAVWAP